MPYNTNLQSNLTD